MSKDYSLEYYTLDSLPDEQKNLDIVKRLRDAEKWNETIRLKGSVLLGQAADEIERLREVLHRISLGSQDSGTTKESLGKEARAALKEGE